MREGRRGYAEIVGTKMRALGFLFFAGLVFSQTAHAQTSQAQPTTTQAPDAQAAQATPVPKPAPVGTMSELMLRVIYPYSDAMFYIQREPPKNDIEWNELAGKALALAEFGNLMMMPGRARDQDQWLRDAKLLAEAGAAALKFAKAKDVDGIVGLNEQLVASCTSCHMHYRPAYGRRRGAAPPQAPVQPILPPPQR
jgi:hypothetical protein